METAETTELPLVVKFLLGESEMDGVWFGESLMDKPPFWWREKLREAFSATPTISEVEIEAEAFVKDCIENEKNSRFLVLDLYAQAKLREGFTAGFKRAVELLTPKPTTK